MQMKSMQIYEETTVWPAYPGNSPGYRVPAIIKAPNNDLLVFAEKRLTPKGGDWGDFEIAMKCGKYHDVSAPEDTLILLSQYR